MTGTDHMTDESVLAGALATLRAFTYLGTRATISDVRERTGLGLMEQQELIAALRELGLHPRARRQITEPRQVQRVQRCVAVLEKQGWIKA